MNVLAELYQEVILDHNRRPRNFGRPEQFSHQAEGYNPLCGDRVQIFLSIEEGRVKEAHFHGTGCAISTASASALTEAVQGKSLEEVKELFSRFRSMLTQDEAGENDLGELNAFQGVRQYPIRVKCATLAWHTLKAALEEPEKTVSTEQFTEQFTE